MKPLAIIRVNGTPLGEQAVERLLSVEVVDEAGDQNDTCKIEFQDDPPVSLPIVGTKVEVSLGWQDVAGATDRMNGVVQRLGEYFLDEIDIEWPPAKVGLTCHAESTASGFKTQKIREWHNTSIGAIVRKIASENGFIPKVDPDFDDTRIPHMDQPNISDMAFLTVLARQYGAVSKVAEGNLFFGARAQEVSVSGQEIPDVELHQSECLRGTYLVQSRASYTGVKAVYQDWDTGMETFVLHGEDRIVKTLPYTYPNERQAQRAAQAHLDDLKREEEELVVVCRGNPLIVAQSKVRLIGFRAGIPDTWRASSVTHRYTGQSFLTSLELEPLV